MYLFSLVSDLSQPPQDFNGEVDLDMFWKALTEERIARGFFSSKEIYYIRNGMSSLFNFISVFRSTI